MAEITITTETILTFDEGNIPPRLIADAIKKSDDGYTVFGDWGLGEIEASGGSYKSAVVSAEVTSD